VNPKLQSISSFHVRFVATILLCSLPFFAIILLTDLQVKHDTRQEMFRRVTVADMLLTREKDQILDGAEKMLGALARLQSSGTEKDLNSLYRQIGALSPHVENAGILYPDGHVASIAHPFAPGTAAFDSQFLDRAIFGAGIVMGDRTRFDSATGKRSLALGLSVKDQYGRVASIAFVLIDAASLGSTWSQALALFPAGTRYAVVDQAGVIISSGPGKFAGQGDPSPWLIPSEVGSTSRHYLRSSVPDGVRRYWFYRKLSHAEYAGPVTILIGVPADLIYTAAESLFLHNSLLLIAVTVLLLVGGLVIGEITVVRPTEDILRTTDSIGSGELASRTRLKYRAGEFGRLSRAIDGMATMIEANVGERQLMMHRLAQSESRYRALFESSPNGIVLIDENLQVSLANSAALQLVGSDTIEGLAGVSILRFIPRDLLGRVVERSRNLSESDGNLTVETDIQDSDGLRVPIEATVSLLPGTATAIRPAVAILRDLRPHRAVETERVRMQEQLAQAQKMETIGLLAGGIAHDFNNLLTVMLGYCGLALLAVEDSSPVHQHLREIQHTAHRAASLTQQLLIFSRKRHLKFANLNVNRVVENMSRLLERLIGETIETRLKLAPNVREILGDQGSIEQLVMNIAVNARDAMPNGGILTIRTDNIEVNDPTRPHCAEERPGPCVVLTIADTGTGMNKETVDQIFEPFFTTKSVGHGTGLGLAVVYGVVKQHGGWIQVASEPGSGTVFSIYLPAADADADSPVT